MRRWLQRAGSSKSDSFHLGGNTVGPAEAKNALKRNVYLSLNCNGEICGRQWRISSSNINPPSTYRRGYFPHRGRGQSRYLWNIDTRRTRPPTVIEAFPQGSGLKRGRGGGERQERKPVEKTRSGEHINGCLEASRRSRLRRTRRGWIIARLPNRHSPVTFRLFIHTLPRENRALCPSVAPG